MSYATVLPVLLTSDRFTQLPLAKDPAPDSTQSLRKVPASLAAPQRALLGVCIGDEDLFAHIECVGVQAGVGFENLGDGHLHALLLVFAGDAADGVAGFHFVIVAVGGDGGRARVIGRMGRGRRIVVRMGREGRLRGHLGEFVELAGDEFAVGETFLVDFADGFGEFLEVAGAGAVVHLRGVDLGGQVGQLFFHRLNALGLLRLRVGQILYLPAELVQLLLRAGILGLGPAEGEGGHYCRKQNSFHAGMKNRFASGVKPRYRTVE